jgi:hypothetical protein
MNKKAIGESIVFVVSVAVGGALYYLGVAIKKLINTITNKE